MADSYELSHVPQQSRGQKLRVGYPESHLLQLQLHDQPISLMSPYLLSCANPDISILNGSKFLKPAQELLDEICDVGFVDRVGVGCGLVVDPTLVDYRNSGALGGGVDWSKRSRLISLLDEVYTRYKQYYRQIQTVITSFDVVAGATPFASLDLNTMSKHFHYLNNAITNQIQLTNKTSYGLRVVNNTDHQPLWRPQRGLPKQAVTVLRAWLFDHFLHPYPTDTDKQWLATQTGLTRNQVSNWFINARVRVWKPMVEEVHTLETKQQVPKMLSEHETSRPSLCPIKLDHHTMEGNKEDMNFCDSFSIYGASANRGVSLTLGLHQNNNATTLPLSVGYGYMY